MEADLHPGFRIRPIFQLFQQCSPWSVWLFSGVPMDGLQMLFCSSFCSLCCSYIKLSLHLRKCPEAPISSASQDQYHTRDVALMAYSRTAEDGVVPLRQWVYALGTEQFVCSHSVLLWILLKRESSVAGGPFVFHVTLSLDLKIARASSVQSYI